MSTDFRIDKQSNENKDTVPPISPDESRLTPHNKLTPIEKAVRKSYLEQVGFDPATIEKMEENSPALWSPNKVDEVISKLTQLGFSDPMSVLIASPTILNLSPENIDSTISLLKNRGIEDPIDAITKHPPILGYSSREGDENSGLAGKFNNLDELGLTGIVELTSKALGWSPETVRKKVKNLADLEYTDAKGKTRKIGKTKAVKMVKQAPTILGHSVEFISERIKFLSALGFVDATKILLNNPRIVGYSEETFNNKLANFRNLGFNPVQLVTEEPELTNLDIDDVQLKVSHLKDIGFANPAKLVLSNPRILQLAEENIDDKIGYLKSLGFGNPITMYEKSPKCLGYSNEKINTAVETFREIGFGDPIEFLESRPGLISCSRERIIHRAKLIQRLCSLYNLPFTPAQIIEYSLSLITSKIDKIIVAVRILRDFKVPTENIKSRLQYLLTQNIDNLLTAYSRGDFTDIDDLLRKSKKIKVSGISQSEKLDEIENGLTNFEPTDPEYKIFTRYFKGYGEDEDESAEDDDQI